MVLRILAILLGLVSSYFLIFRTEDIESISWAIRHGVDEEGRKQQHYALRVVGVMILAFSIFGVFRLFT